MNEFNIEVNGGVSVRLPTGGKYCDRDIIVTAIGDSSEGYIGEYTVIPSRQEQVLETANKVLSKNVTVTAIPYSEVSNLGGGTTFYIAKENE